MHSVTKYYDDNFEIIELKNKHLSAKIIVNIGNTLFSLLKENEEQLYFPYTFKEYASNVKLAGNPFMHPWANRLEEDAILVENKKHAFPKDRNSRIYRDGNHLPLHGLLLKSQDWNTEKLFETVDTCYHAASFSFDNISDLSFFPFLHTITIKHQLKGNELSIETTIKNLDEKDMPVSFGFHPYFLIDPYKRKNYSLTIPAKEVIGVDQNMIPNNIVSVKEEQWKFSENKIALTDISFDDGFQDLFLDEKEKAIFKLNDRKICFDKNFPVAQVYAPLQLDKPYVCIEPMTAITNALLSAKCVKIKKQETYTAVFTIVL